MSKPVPILPAKTKSLAVVVADEQGAETDARTLRIGEPAHDELLRRLALHLQPVLRAAVLVRRAAALGDHAFPSFAAGALPRRSSSTRSTRRIGAAKRQRVAAARGVLRAAARVTLASVEPQDVEDVVAARCRPTSTSPSRITSCTGRRAMAAASAGDVCGRRLREYSRTSPPFLNASSRMPSNLRSNSQSASAEALLGQRRGHRLEPVGQPRRCHPRSPGIHFTALS